MGTELTQIIEYIMTRDLVERLGTYSEDKRLRKFLKKTEKYIDRSMVTGTAEPWVPSLKHVLRNTIELPYHIIDDIYQKIKLHVGEQPPLPVGFKDFAHRSAVLTDNSYEVHGERSHFRNWTHMKHFSNDRISVHEQPHTGNWHVAIRGTKITKIQDHISNAQNIVGLTPSEEAATHAHLRSLAKVHKVLHPDSEFELSGHSQGGKWTNDMMDMNNPSNLEFINHVTRSMSHESAPTISSRHSHPITHHKIHKNYDFVSALDNPASGAHHHFLHFLAGGSYHSTITNPDVWDQYMSDYDSGLPETMSGPALKDEL